jgi:hypothetical protein
LEESVSPEASAVVGHELVQLLVRNKGVVCPPTLEPTEILSHLPSLQELMTGFESSETGKSLSPRSSCLRAARGRALCAILPFPLSNGATPRSCHSGCSWPFRPSREKEDESEYQDEDDREQVFDLGQGVNEDVPLLGEEVAGQCGDRDQDQGGQDIRAEESDRRHPTHPCHDEYQSPYVRHETGTEDRKRSVSQEAALSHLEPFPVLRL